MLLEVIAVIAMLVVPVQLQQAQDQPEPKQNPPPFNLATADYNFLIASGFLCDPDHSHGCPAVAQAGGGESIEMSGAGTLSLAGNSVTGAGAFTEKSASGHIVATGVWTAIALVSFQSYGLAPGALLRDYPGLRAVGTFTKGDPRAPRPMMPGPMANWMFGPLATGGLAVIRIRMLPDAGTPTDAVLRVNCARGKVPEDEQSDGVRLTITGGPTFDQQVSGNTVFLLRRPEREVPGKNSNGGEQR